MKNRIYATPAVKGLNNTYRVFIVAVCVCVGGGGVDQQVTQKSSYKRGCIVLTLEKIYHFLYETWNHE